MKTDNMRRTAVLVAFFLAGMFLVHLPDLQAGDALTWGDALRETASNHPDLIAAGEEIVQGRASKTIAAAGAYPQVSADLSTSSTHSKNSGSQNIFAYGVSGTQLVFDGLKTVNNVHAASENIRAARENFRFTSANVRFRLREAFINLLRAQQLSALTEEIRQLRQTNLDLIMLRYQSGTEHKGALLTAQANLSQAVFEIRQAERSR